MKIIRIALTCLVFIMASCKSTQKAQKIASTPKNVILLISDGTGLSQISSAFYYQDQKPNYTRFNTIGLIKTSSSQEDVTDSAAGATAFACGIKTYNGAIGVDDDKADAENLVEIVSQKNIKTGMIATSSITHATPASFYAHTASRSSEEEIAEYLVNSEVDFFAGGGLQYFNKRKDNQNLLNRFKEDKYTINTTALDDFEKISSHKKVGYLLAEGAMPKMQDDRGDFLVKAIDLGIQYLSKDNSPFFMMAEGSQIDWGGHNNDAPYLIAELLDFDKAIGAALDYAEKDGNTLVIVTSDHETGGFTLAAKKKKREDGSEYSDYSEIGPTFSTGGHSATLIPVFAFGPGAEQFDGIYENTAIFDKILEVTGWRK
ncbi:alkaline phosphatase [Leeuwenhoekiella marinoflava]|uniref:Alkaline phosphatase n=2 Tax=Leeuwenhoekiella marinoflava TaxID=988 RepID=A0A4Q0PGV8_9FLAO|nr:alkaline phosphatase [Leeuwenhoekiella marinoflava]RXG25888.1 alkaline phosphatase [Leeuwenhoekiella marinoflava]SHF99864.1 alkaline phosphatase [Leeuwenhoekiella marinoflava DSM 3653]